MRFSTEPNILKFLEVYDAGTDVDRECIPWEAWAIKARVKPTVLMGEIIFALRQQSVDLIKVLAITGHPDTVRARLKNAKTPQGVKDRDALDIALGFAPQQKGATFIGKYFQSGARDPEDAPEPSRVIEPDVDELFPDLEQTQFLLTE